MDIFCGLPSAVSFIFRRIQRYLKIYYAGGYCGDAGEIEIVRDRELKKVNSYLVAINIQHLLRDINVECIAFKLKRLSKTIQRAIIRQMNQCPRWWCQ